MGERGTHPQAGKLPGVPPPSPGVSPSFSFSRTRIETDFLYISRIFLLSH